MSTEQNKNQEQNQNKDQDQDQQSEKEKIEELRKVMDAMETAWWNTKPYMGNCGNCQKYAMLRPQDAGMFCYDC